MGDVLMQQLELFPPGEWDGGVHLMRWPGHVDKRGLARARKTHKCREFGSPGGASTQVLPGLTILPDP